MTPIWVRSYSSLGHLLPGLHLDVLPSPLRAPYGWVLTSIVDLWVEGKNHCTHDSVHTRWQGGEGRDTVVQLKKLSALKYAVQ